MINTGLRYFVAFLLLISSGYTSLYAQIPGTIDTNFHRGTGINRLVYDGVEDNSSNVVIVGNFPFVNQRTIRGMARLLPDGTTDYSFNPNGAGTNGLVNVIEKQTNGQYIIAGAFTTYNGVTTNRIARINTNGTKDASFTGNVNGEVKSIIIQSDDKIVVAGAFTTVNGVTTNRIARLNNDGTRDATFNPGTGANNNIWEVRRQADGKYIIVGEFTIYNGTAINRVARLNADGTLDATFNVGSGANVNTISIAIAPNGKIYLGGMVTYNGETVNRLTRVNPDGARDTTFDVGSGLNNYPYEFLLESDGKLVVTGSFTAYNGSSINGILRIDSTGKRDTSFTIGGGFTGGLVHHVSVGSDNKYLVLGDFSIVDNFIHWGGAKLNYNGTLFHDFMRSQFNNAQIRQVALQSDGKVIAAGEFTKYGNKDIRYLIRFNKDGTIDTTFNPGTGPNSVAYSVTVLPNDKILIGGNFSSYNGTTANRFARLNSDGTLDNTFSLGSGFNGYVLDIEVLPSGKIYAGGNFTTYKGLAATRLIRLNADGTRDNSFSITINNGGVTNILPLPNGKVVVSGEYTLINGMTHNTIVRLDTSGVVDTTFRSGTGFESASTNYVPLLLQPDGKIIVGFGVSRLIDGVSRNRIARLNTNGRLDLTFNTANTAITNGTVYDLELLNNGFVASGTFTNLFKYFDLNGVANTTDFINPVTIAPSNVFSLEKDNKNGRIITGGLFYFYQDMYFSTLMSLKNSIENVSTQSSFCQSENGQIYFDKRLAFNSGNIFTAQLSNASGSFASPVTIGIDTIDGWGPDSMRITIPLGTATGTGYKIRVVSTSPSFTSAASLPITINALPSQKIILQAATDVYPSLTTQVKVVASQTGVHYSLMNDTTVVDTGSGTGDTLRLYTNGIYNTTDFTIIAQASGCSRILDTVIVDTLQMIPMSWQLEGITELPDHSLHVIPGNGKPEAKGYNLMKAGQNGAVLYRFESGDNYEGMFGLVNPEGDGEYFFTNVLIVDTGKWDSTGLYFAINKDDVIYLRPAITSNVDVLLKKTGTSLGVYFNGLLDTTIVWPDTVSFSPLISPFEGTGSVSGIYSSYGAILHGTVSAQNINCGDNGNASASISGGSPPYHFHWSNGDTTSAPDSLLVGKYILTVTDFANDTLVDSVEIAYNALWDTLGNVEPDTVGRLVSVNNTGPFSSYTWAVNSLAESEEGWVQFEVEAGTIFQGSLGTGSNKLIDETTRGVSILVLGNGVYCTGSQFEDMPYLGWYEPGEGYKFRIRFDDDYVYFSKLEEYGGEMDISVPFARGYDFRPGVVPFENGNVIPEVSTSFGCDAMFANVSVVPAETMNDQATIRVDVKGGKSPYTYLWSNAATTSTLNVSPGIYTVTITDQNSTTITAQVFAGTYVEWLAANNVEETDDHEIICTETIPVGYSMRYNYIFGKSALKADQDGTVSFDFEKAKDFCGGIGLITDNLASDGSQGFGVFVIQDRLEIGLDKDVYFIDDEGDMQYLGSFENNVAMNIKVRKQGNTLEVIKNDFGGISREYDEPYIFHPFASPIFQNDKITRVTVNFGSPLQLLSNIQHPACNGNTLGSIDLTAIGGEPPYHYLWSNGDTIADPDSLGIGLYAVTAWDSQNDTIIDSLYVGYAIVWDTLINVDDSLGMLKSNGNNSTVSFNSYAYGLNSLAPEEDGWIEFVLPERTMFNGAVGMVGNKHYDETSEGIAFNIVNDIMAVSGNMLENSELFGEYKTAAGYKLRIDIAGDNITLTKGDIFGFGPGRKQYYTYHRTEHWSPSVIFGLNGAKVASVSSSFGCGRMHVETRSEPASKDGSVGSIYTDVKGGVAPYTYTWSNSATTANILNVPLGNYTVTVEDQLGDEQVINTFLGRYVDWDVLSGMAEIATEVIYDGDTVDFDSTIINFAFGRNAIKPGETGTVSFDFERAADFTGAVGFAESADLSISQDGALAIIGVIEGESLYVLDESGNPAYFGKLRENLPVNILFKKTPTEFEVNKNGISSIFINTPTTGFLSPIVAPGFPGDKVHRVTCDFGKRLKIIPDVTPIECGTVNTGSITAIVSGGIPPHTYYWNTGDTTDTNDSLIVGDYSVLVIDSIGDSTAANITMGYATAWHALVGVTAALDNSLSPVLPFSEGNAYAVGASTLYPIVGEIGWMEFEVKAGVPFEGYFGLVNEMTFDENMVGVGILIEDGYVYSTSTDPENENLFLGKYNQSIENKIRISKLGDNSIEIKVNGIILLYSDYDYPTVFSPVVYLNSAKSRVKSLVSSFCNTYQDEFTIAYEVVHNTDKRSGGIYIEPVGGTPPFQYLWSDLGGGPTHLDALYTSDALSELGIDSTEIDSLISGYPTSNGKNRSNLEIGDYTVTVTDAASHTVVQNFEIGYVSRFLITKETLSNNQGVITKTGTTPGFSDNACISLGSCNDTINASFSFQILAMGDFDFGYRDLPESLLLEDLSAVSNFDYDANEYYYLEIRSGQITYKSTSDSPALISTGLQNGDIVTMSLIDDNVIIKKNGNIIATKVRSSSSSTFLHTVARLYNHNSSFKILENVLF